MITIIYCLLSISSAERVLQGDVFILIQVWGEVKSPGIYPVPTTTNLVEAISFAGGPTSRSDLDRVKLVKALRGKSVMYYDVDAYIKGEKRDPPILDSGDLVFVSQSLTSHIYDFVRFVAIVAGVAWSIYQIASD